jgi:hypothetical protein
VLPVAVVEFAVLLDRAVGSRRGLILGRSETDFGALDSCFDRVLSAK